MKVKLKFLHCLDVNSEYICSTSILSIIKNQKFAISQYLPDKISLLFLCRILYTELKKVTRHLLVFILLLNCGKSNIGYQEIVCRN